MTKEDKLKRKKERAQLRYQKNITRNLPKLYRKRNYGTGMDCPFDVEMNNLYGTCTCGGKNYNTCAGEV